MRYREAAMEVVYMVESGVRFVVTTEDCVYITPTVTRDLNQGTITILDMSDLGGPAKRVIDLGLVESIVRENYTQEDVTSSFVVSEQLLTLA